MIWFLKLFIILFVLGIAIFLMICTEYGFECALPNSGYFRIKWNPEKKKIELFYWQPKTNVKPLPQNVIKIHKSEEEQEEKKQD